ncbi:unnamed protein product [Pleuronectes platessa]|uniref:Uncharacterized protein n=1 Tax=Pleuronectes platessa TaxID=8262 RepID=A0A9N7VLB1_PLEPL|nr:unnamed protein product [Pleuronectes platessa]
MIGAIICVLITFITSLIFIITIIIFTFMNVDTVNAINAFIRTTFLKAQLSSCQYKRASVNENYTDHSTITTAESREAERWTMLLECLLAWSGGVSFPPPPSSFIATVLLKTTLMGEAQVLFEGTDVMRQSGIRSCRRLLLFLLPGHG